MCAVAGEIADGVRLHPVCTPRFIDEEVLPAVAKGAGRSSRDVAQIEVCLKPLIGTAVDAAALRKVTETVRARVAFYLSTPSYRCTFELHGWGEAARQASELSRAQRWDDMPSLVHDEMLHTVATIGTFEEIVGKLNERYANRVDRLEFSIPVNGPADAEMLSGILDQLD